MIRERLAMRVFERMGIPAPRVAHARLYLGSDREFAGVYGLVEAIDKEFLKRAFGENDGHLYEYRWRDEYRFEDMSSLDWYAARFDPKKHETASTSALFGPLRELVRTINNAPRERLEAELAAQLNVRTYITHLAIENYLSEPDGILGGLGMNNFYPYRFEGKDLWQLIPWDKDLTFESIESPRPWERNTDNVLTKKIWESPELRRVYLQALLTLAQSTGPWLEEEIAREYSQIREAALTDTLAPHSRAQFEESIAFLRRFARERGPIVRRLVAEEDPALAAAVSGTVRFPSRGRRTPE